MLKANSEKSEKSQADLREALPTPAGIGQNIKKITVTCLKTGVSNSFDSITEAAKFYIKEGLLADSLGDRLNKKSSKPYKGHVVS